MWCRKNVGNRKVYITKVDKGGSIIILDSSTVEEATMNDTSKYEALPKDPRKDIRSDIMKLIDNYVESSLLTPEDRWYLTGRTLKDGWSHDHSFKMSAPYMYPLYKLHKLSREQIIEKAIPPARMVTSGVNGPTYRVGVFLDHILKPVSLKYCFGELVRDTTEFVSRLENLKDNNLISPGDNLAALDIVSLYPNIKIEIAVDAIMDALSKITDYSGEQIDMILELTRFSLNNSVVHYRGGWYKSCEGAPTGGPEVPAIANIHVKYVLDEKILIDERVKKRNKLRDRSRFLDDIWGRWIGTQRTFEIFKTTINEVGRTYGITFTGECGKSVVFMDVTTIITPRGLETTMFVKPTDSIRYLHRRSGHSEHVFSGIPYSQFRRASVICSTEDYKLQCIERMENKFILSGYKKEDLLKPKARALALDRSSVLNNTINDTNERPMVKSDVMAFVIYQYPALRRELTQFFRDYEDDLRQLVGDVRFVVSERKHPNTASLLFGKSSFSQLKPVLHTSQKCHRSNCLSCVSMNLPKQLVINNVMIKMDYHCDCSSDSVIYLARCKTCVGTVNEEKSFYFGQTVSKCRTRLNGHREKFKISKYDESALSNHTYEMHVENFNEKLLNYDFGIVKKVSPQNLNRSEDYYIYKTKADTKGLNRYKVAS